MHLMTSGPFSELLHVAIPEGVGVSILQFSKNEVLLSYAAD